MISRRESEGERGWTLLRARKRSSERMATALTRRMQTGGLLVSMGY
jgi:hypothetical protein